MIRSGMYVLSVRSTGKFYVGSSIDVQRRIEQHIRELNKNIHANINLQTLWNDKKNLCVLTETIFYTDTIEEARLLEQDTIDLFKDSQLMLNIGLGVSGGNNLSRNPNKIDILKRIKEALIARLGNLTVLEKKILYGRSGVRNGMYGKTHSDEVKDKLSKINLGRKHTTSWKLTDEQRNKISNRAKLRTGKLNPFFGKQHSLKTREKLSTIAKLRNLLPSNARKVKIDGVVYDSLSMAAASKGVTPALISYRILSNKIKYSGYKYLT